MRYIIITIIISLFIFSCNNLQDDFKPENYDELFPPKDPDDPVISYEDMDLYPCNPTASQENFNYPGVEISENVRTYTVSLKVYFDEKHRLPGLTGVYSKLDVSFVNIDKKLEILRTYKENGVEPVLKNKEIFEKTFKVKSGYPLYLGVSGAGFDYFSTSIVLKAKSDDGVIIAPTLSYKAKTNRDGYDELSPYCQQVILP